MKVQDGRIPPNPMISNIPLASVFAVGSATSLIIGIILNSFACLAVSVILLCVVVAYLIFSLCAETNRDKKESAKIEEIANSVMREYSIMPGQVNWTLRRCLSEVPRTSKVDALIRKTDDTIEECELVIETKESDEDGMIIVNIYKASLSGTTEWALIK